MSSTNAKTAERIGKRLTRDLGVLAALDAAIAAGEPARPGSPLCVFVRRRKCWERVQSTKKDLSELLAGVSAKPAPAPNVGRLVDALKGMIDAAENMAGRRSGELVNAMDFARLVLREEGAL